MTIKISSITTAKGEVTLTLSFDNPSGTGQMQNYILRKQDFVQRLLQVRTLLGRPLTLQDARESLIAIVNEARAGKLKIPEDFDFTPYIGQELEK